VTGSLEPGRSVGPYVVEALVGTGGMGAVYRARDVRLGRRVALKVVRRDREDRSGVAPEDRLIAEARAVAALRHPHVVQVFDAGVAEGHTYVAMEYVEGRPLREWIGDASVPLARRMRWLTEIGDALAAAHRAGLVHRDVKPSNVIIDEEGSARVLDFGLAKRVALDADAPTADAPQPETAEGRVLGTVSYMPPEQLAGGPPDAKWDQFAWGVTAYELLTGVHPRLAVPMPGQTAHLTQTPKMPNELAPDVPFAAAAAVMLAMAPDPTRRFASMNEALAALHDDTSGRPAPRPVVAAAGSPAPSSRRRVAFIAAAIAGLAAGVAVWAAVRSAGAPVDVREPSARAPSASVAPTSAPPTTASTVAPRAPSASPPAASAVVASPPAHSRPADYGTSCACMADSADGQLCPLDADVHRRWCWCVAEPTHLTNPKGGLEWQGRDLTDGMPCKGQDGQTMRDGHLGGCGMDCKWKGFAGIHRTPCRGRRPTDGVVESGLLLCF
jgi:predicted Ser/Thr protein kinase